MINAKNPATLKDTGERMIPEYHKGHLLYGEHIVRYNSISEIVKDKIVLDIASGSGYGTSIIGKAAKKVYGVDISAKAINYAKKTYSSINVDFVKGNALDIPLPDSSVDVVVSFETIEHVKDYLQFISEIKRVLKKDGMLVLSTPNDKEFPEYNEFHVHDFNLKELNSKILPKFKFHEVFYQASWVLSGLLARDDMESEWSKELRVINAAPLKAEKSVYFLLLLSDRKITESIEPTFAISDYWSDRKNYEYEKSVRSLIDEQGKIIKFLEDKLKVLEAEGSSSIVQYAKKISRLKKRILK